MVDVPDGTVRRIFLELRQLRTDKRHLAARYVQRTNRPYCVYPETALFRRYLQRVICNSVAGLMLNQANISSSLVMAYGWNGL
jgi:hypothetical protein